MKHHPSQLALDFDAPPPPPSSALGLALRLPPSSVGPSRPGASAVRLPLPLRTDDDPIDPADPFAAEYADMRRYRRTWTSSRSRVRRIRVVHGHHYPISNCLRCLNTRLLDGLPCPVPKGSPTCVLETWAKP